jgi:hypothetical protein
LNIRADLLKELKLLGPTVAANAIIARLSSDYTEKEIHNEFNMLLAEKIIEQDPDGSVRLL